MSAPDILFLIFAAVAFVGVCGGIVNRIVARKGIGSQFIRYIALVVALPMAGTFVFQGMVTEAVVSLVFGILGYVFPGPAKEG